MAANHYQTLGADAGMDADELRAAYRRAAAAAHPDREGGNSEEMKRVNAAWEVLGDPEARAAYDAEGSGDPAVKRVIMLFERFLDSGGMVGGSDIVAGLIGGVVRANSELEAIARVATRKIEKLTLDRTRLTGPKLYERVCDRKLAAEAARIVDAEAEIAINQRVIAMLREYRQSGTAPAAQWLSHHAC